jgi:type I restriction enzyme S subunit
MTKNNYKRLGDFIQKVDVRNTENEDLPLMGLSIEKKFIPSIANTIGTDMRTYRVIKSNHFAYGPVTSRNGEKITIALFSDYDRALISQAYVPFEIIDNNLLEPQYLMMWFRRPEFDRYARFKSHGSARETFDWDEMCDVELPVPTIEKQREIVQEYQVVEKRIALNEQLIAKLEETAQAVYREWFVEFEFPDEDGKPYKSNGGKMVWNEELEKEVPEGWEVSTIGGYATVKSGYAFKSAWWQTEGIPVIKIGSISNNTIDYSQVDFISSINSKKASGYEAQKGDVVIAMTGATIGKIGVIPEMNSSVFINQRVGLFDLGKEPFKKNAYLYINMLSDYVQNEIQNVGGDSAQANVSNTQIQNIKLLMPEQYLINNYNSFGRIILEDILLKVELNQKLEELKDLLLTRMII